MMKRTFDKIDYSSFVDLSDNIINDDHPKNTYKLIENDFDDSSYNNSHDFNDDSDNSDDDFNDDKDHNSNRYDIYSNKSTLSDNYSTNPSQNKLYVPEYSYGPKVSTFDPNIITNTTYPYFGMSGYNKYNQHNQHNQHNYTPYIPIPPTQPSPHIPIPSINPNLYTQQNPYTKLFQSTPPYEPYKKSQLNNFYYSGKYKPGTMNDNYNNYDDVNEYNNDYVDYDRKNK